MLPRIAPILPVLSKIVPTGPEWVYEPKLDGFRGVLYLQNGRASFSSKTSKPMPRFADLAHELAQALAAHEAILDGEIVVMGSNGPDFNALFRRTGKPSYLAFDLLWLDGEDLRALPLTQRKKLLRKLLAKSPIGAIEPVRDPRLFEAAVRLDLEGIVAKRRGDPYAAQTQWMKIKHAGYTQQQGRAELFHRAR